MIIVPTMPIKQLCIGKSGVTCGAMRPTCLTRPRVVASSACRLHLTSLLELLQCALAHLHVYLRFLTTSDVAHVVNTSPRVTLLATVTYLVGGPNVLVRHHLPPFNWHGHFTI